MRDYSEALLRQLQRTAERSGLDTVETEVLIQSASTEMENHSQSSSAAMKALTNGWRGLDLTMNKPGLEDALLATMLQAVKGVRYAIVIRKPDKPAKVTAYFGRPY